jgi:hypothetical protein
MIRYALACTEGHEFDGWFPSSDSFDEQVRRKLVECPHCGDRGIRKTLMAPAVSTSRKRTATAREGLAEAARQVEPAPSTQPASEAGQLAALPPEKRALVDELRKIKQRLMEGAEDVGGRFPEEARKIHYGEAKSRGIYGQATATEARELADEGIEFLPLPDLPDERN